MKKVLVLMMGAVMLLALAACGSEKQEESKIRAALPRLSMTSHVVDLKKPEVHKEQHG